MEGLTAVAISRNFEKPGLSSMKLMQSLGRLSRWYRSHPAALSTTTKWEKRLFLLHSHLFSRKRAWIQLNSMKIGTLICFKASFICKNISSFPSYHHGRRHPALPPAIVAESRRRRESFHDPNWTFSPNRRPLLRLCSLRSGGAGVHTAALGHLVSWHRSDLASSPALQISNPSLHSLTQSSTDICLLTHFRATFLRHKPL